MQNSRSFPDEQIKASSEMKLKNFPYIKHRPSQGRLYFQETEYHAGSWVANTTDGHQWLEIDLGAYYHTYEIPSTVKGVATQGRNYNKLWPHGKHSQWVTKYTLQYSVNGASFQDYVEQGQTKAKVKILSFVINIFLLIKETDTYHQKRQGNNGA